MSKQEETTEKKTVNPTATNVFYCKACAKVPVYNGNVFCGDCTHWIRKRVDPANGGYLNIDSDSDDDKL